MNIIRSIEQSTAKMMKAERERFIKDLYTSGIITEAEYEMLRRELV